jgi:hypothetical protein
MRYLVSLILFPFGLLGASFTEDQAVPGRVILSADPSLGKIEIPSPAPHITRAYFMNDDSRSPLNIAFNEDATAVSLVVPEALRQEKGEIALEVAKNTTAFDDGRVTFSALDSKVVGKKAKLESHPGNHRIGFWGNSADYVTWDYKPGNVGMYSVELTYSLAGRSSEIEISLGDAKVAGTIQNTGTWYEYTAVDLGYIYINHRNASQLAVKCLKKNGGAVMNLKAVTLRPAPEGNFPIAKADHEGSISLMPEQATVYGRKLMWEPQPKKLCLGYWVHVEDFATWEVEVPAAGNYRVEIFQGCAPEQGGSSVTLSGNGAKEVTFEVQETGGFQDFVAREVGTISFAGAGQFRMKLKADKIADKAVMDLQKIVLYPTK